MIDIVKNSTAYFLALFVLLALFEYTNNFSIYHLSINLYQPHDLKGLLKVSMYLFSYLFISFNLILIFLMKKGKLFYIVSVLVIICYLLDVSYYQNGLNRGFSTSQFVTLMHQKTLILNAISTFYLGGLKALFFIALLFYLIINIRKNINQRYYYTPLIFLLFSFFGANLVIKDTVSQIYNYPSYVKVPLSIYNAYSSGLIHIPYKQRDRLTTYPIADSAYTNIILIVDESVRGDYLSINGFGKRTTPYLESLNNLLNLGVVSSVSNSSASSNYILRTGVIPDELPDTNFNTLLKPTIFQYAKNAGFNTSFLDAQANYDSLQNNMSTYDLEYVDTFITFRKKQNNYMLDRIMLEKISSILENNTHSNFIYFVKYGSHFRWKLNYPESEEIFTPTLSIYDALDFDHRSRAVNTYMNSVRWGVDSFFKDLLSTVDTTNTLIIYTADHGQNILENNILVTHGLEHNPPSCMANVPMFFYSDKIDDIKNKFKTNISNNYSQFQLFPSLLELMGYDDETVNIYGDTFWNGEVKNRRFYSGHVFGSGHFNSFNNDD